MAKAAFANTNGTISSSNHDGVRSILCESLKRAEVILSKKSSRSGQNLRETVDKVEVALAAEDVDEQDLLRLLAETEAQVQMLSAPLDAKAIAQDLQELTRLVGRLDTRVDEDVACCKALREHLEMELSSPCDDTYKKLARDLKRASDIMDAKLRDAFEATQAAPQNRSVGAQLQGIIAGSQKPTSNDSCGQPLVLPKLVVGEEGESITSNSQGGVLQELRFEGGASELDARDAEMRAQQTTQILEDMQCLQKIQQTLAEVAEEQSVTIGLVEDHVGEVRNNSANAGSELAKAARSQSSSWTLKGGLSTSAVGAVVGLACGGPLGLALGAAAGGGAGGLTGKWLKRKYRKGVDSAEASLQGGEKK